VLYAFDDIKRFRSLNIEEHRDSLDDEANFNIRYSIEKKNKILSIISVVKTTMVCIILIFSSLSIQQDA